MATTATAAKSSTNRPTPVADVTGTKKKGRQKGVSIGPRTTPTFTTSYRTEENREMIGAITKGARAIANRNGGYVNAEMVRREMESHPAFQKLLTNGGEAVIPVPAYQLLTVQKIKELHALGIEGWLSLHPDGDPYGEDSEKEAPKNGPFAKFAQSRGGRIELTEDEANEL